MVDPGAPWPFRDTPTIRDYERLVNMRHYDPERRHDEPRLVADMDRVIAVDYALHPLAALAEATVAATGDYELALALLRSLRAALRPLSTSRRTYIRYLMLTLIEDGPAIVRQGSNGWRPGPDPIGYWDVSPELLQSSARAVMWDPMRRVTLDTGYVQGLITDWLSTGGSGLYVNRVASPLADGLGVRSGLDTGSAIATVLSLAADLHVQRKSDTVVDLDGRVGRWTKVAYATEGVWARTGGWVFSGDITESDNTALFDPAPSAPAPWPTEASSQGRNACVPGSSTRPHTAHVLPYVGDQEAVIVDVTGDTAPDILAAGADGLVAVDGANRRLVWIHRRAAGSVPTVWQDVVYVDDTHAGGQFACALDAESGQVLWQTPLCRYRTPNAAAPVVVGDHAFFRADDGLRTLAAASGETVRRRPSAGGGSWVATDGVGVVYFAVREVDRTELNADMQASDGSVARSRGRSYGQAVLHGGRAYTLYPGSPYAGALHASDLTDDSWVRLWARDTVSAQDCRPVIDGRDLFLLRDVRGEIRPQGMTQRLRAYRWPGEGSPHVVRSDRDSFDLALQWEYRYGRAFLGNPVADATAVYIASEDGVIHAVSRETGKALWTHQLPRDRPAQKPGPGDWTPISLAQGRVLMGWEGHLYVLMPSDEPRP
jgi:outer membrane protein assembly factor BamB